MKLLPKEFSKKGFSFVQKFRKGDFAIFEVKKDSHSVFDVVHIQKHNGYEIAGNYFEPAEFYPRSEDWGVNAYTALTYSDALKYLEKLKKNVKK